MNNPGVVVPPVPEKNPYRRFDQGFVEQRRLALEKCIQKIANHPVLQKDSDLKMFLESDTFALDVSEPIGGLLLRFAYRWTYSRSNTGRLNSDRRRDSWRLSASRWRDQGFTRQTRCAQ